MCRREVFHDWGRAKILAFFSEGVDALHTEGKGGLTVKSCPSAGFCLCWRAMFDTGQTRMICVHGWQTRKSELSELGQRTTSATTWARISDRVRRADPPARVERDEL